MSVERKSPSRSSSGIKKPDETRLESLKRCAESPLGSGNLRLAVKLPEGELEYEWLASNTNDFFNQINMLYGTLTDYCTPETCPVMSAGERYEYHWPADPKKNSREVIKVSAPAYIDLLMTWVQGYLDDESVFPTKIGNPFPKDFIHIVRQIFKRLFRVYAHIYHSHFKVILYEISAESHLNTSFKHFIYFVLEFGLMDRVEMIPLAELIDTLLAKDAAKERDRERSAKE